jgi:hypothetical protein
MNVFDIAGQKIDNLVYGNRPLGLNKIMWNAHDHNSGIYFVQMEANNQLFVRKIVLLK